MIELTIKHLQILKQVPDTANVKVNVNSIVVEFPPKQIAPPNQEFTLPYFITWLEMNDYKHRRLNNIVTLLFE
jgi:hypothetical protein